MNPAMRAARLSLSGAFAMIAACGSSESGPASSPGDADPVVADTNLPAIDAAQIGLPTWMLEDIQPASPRVGQTYGLATFNQKIIIVSLLEGF